MSPLSAEDERLVGVYAQVGHALDDLPYTEAFERLYVRLQELGDSRSKQDVFRRLLTLRKAGRLPWVQGLPRSDGAA